MSVSYFNYWFKVFILIVVLGSVAEAQKSPCPDVFKYLRDSRNNAIYGRATILYPTYGTHTLEVTLSLKAPITSSFTGKITLLNENTIGNAISNKEAFIYRIDFPLRSPIPRLQRLKFRGILLCAGPPETLTGPGQHVTTIKLNHTLNAKLVHTQINIPNQNDYVTTDYVQNTNRPIYQQVNQVVNRITYATSPPVQVTTRRPTIRPVKTTLRPYVPQVTQASPNYDDNEICGRNHREVVHLIVNGEETSAGDWPWLVALYKKKKNIELSYICTGTLISTKMVVSAAHCTYSQSKKLTNKDFLLRIGVHNIQSWDEDNAQTRDVSELLYPPKYKPFDPTYLDMVILVLARPVKYNSFVRPICIWSGNKNIPSGTVGSVVGWGKDENDIAVVPEPRLARVPVVSNEQCLQTDPIYKKYLNEFNFCAGATGYGPCNGDSGGGLYVKRNNRYELKGIVSKSLGDGSNTCNLDKYVLYADAAVMKGWLMRMIDSN